MRPTIPLGPWRLAVDLAATRALQALPSRPTHGCTCAACQLWAVRHVTLLPPGLAAELLRVGVDPATPAEAYVLTEGPTSAGLRLSYVAVGRIVRGPAELVEHAETGAGRLYVPLRTDAEEYLALAVAYQHTLAAPPDWLQPAPESLLAIDLFLRVPRTRDVRPRRPAPGAAV